MKKNRFSTKIKAPKEKVWNVLWDDATYREWTRVFSEGSYAVSDWNEGSTVQFLDPESRSGMSAIIEKKRPGEFMSFRHQAEIRNGRIQPPSEWSGAHEDYTLTTNGSRTTLTVDLDAPDEHRQMFESKFPQALQQVKRLSETT